MATLTFTDKRNIEKLFGMGSGYVLDFSNRTFAEFITDSTGINIYDARYEFGSGSKANRFRKFMEIEEDTVVGKVLGDILNYGFPRGIRRRESETALVEDCRQTAARLTQNGPKPEKQKDTVEKRVLNATQYDRLAAALNDLLQKEAQARGFAFEHFLDETFALFNLAPRRSFRLVGEQIDGSFHLGSETYLVEAKWQSDKIGNRELQAFAGCVRTKASWSRGAYISYSGFTEDGLIAFAHGDATRIICLDGLELWQIINHKLDFTEVLSLKTRRAAETGRAHVSVRELFPAL